MSERHCFPVLVHALIASGDRLLLLRRAGTGLFDGYWAPPGGHVEAGEAPRAAAVRESREEVGLELDGKQLRAVGLFHYGRDQGGFNLIFAADVRDPLPPSFDRGSADAADWWPRTALPEPRVPWLAAALERADRTARAGRSEDGAWPRDLVDWYVEGH